MRKRVLLVVDDEPMICKIISRKARDSFDEVHTATSSAAAGSILERSVVTHLVCDFDLGPEEPTGGELIPGWRDTFKNVEYAALYTGSCPDSLTPRDGIDNIYSKPLEFGSLLESLRVR